MQERPQFQVRTSKLMTSNYFFMSDFSAFDHRSFKPAKTSPIFFWKSSFLCGIDQ